MALTVLVGYLNEFLCWFLDLVKCILWQVASKGTELTLQTGCCLDMGIKDNTGFIIYYMNKSLKIICYSN